MSMTTKVMIAGWNHHPGADAALQLMEREFLKNSHLRLVLRREPDNKFDGNAVAIHSAYGTKLGYVPRGDARTVARVMDAGVQVRARYDGKTTAKLWWPAATREGVDEAYRRAMFEGEGI